MTKTHTSALTAAALLLGLAACAVGTTAPTLAPAPNPNARAHRSSPRFQVSGVVNVDNWNIPAGEHDVVDGDLFVFATKTIVIDGKLDIEAGRKVAFFTPSFTLGPKAAIAPLATGTMEPSPPPLIVSGCTILVQGSVTVGAGRNLEVSSSGKAPAGQHCLVAFLAGSTFAMAKGIAGGTIPGHPEGGAGGSVVIGAPKALADADAIAKAHEHGELKASSPDALNLGIALNAGYGGDAMPNPKPTKSGNTYSVKLSDGGAGGAVDITVRKIIGTFPHVVAGQGGNGGTLGENSKDYPINGTKGAPDAANVTIAQGAGGEGGLIDVTAQKPGKYVETPGDGGSPSTLMFDGVNGTFYAGQGYSYNDKGALTTGAGGSVELKLALPGARGGSGAKNGQYVAVTFYGGNGGNANGLGFSGAPDGTLIQGGAGGSLTLVLPKDTKAKDLAQMYGLKVSVSLFGSGGNSGLKAPAGAECPSNPPAGDAGGNAGTWNDNGLFDVMYPNGKNFGSGFNGGGGSNGKPAGAGGSQGTTSEGNILGIAGTKGIEC